MKTTHQMHFSKDIAGKTIHIIREFSAPLDQVWDAWTKSALLDLWWAPKPWKAMTKSMDLREGGFWLYCMTGPNGEQHWARVDYAKLDPRRTFTANDSFCDEDGKKNLSLPSTTWKNTFTHSGIGTTVIVEMTFKEEADLNTIIEMGFEQGFEAALRNLDELLEK
jgi:uncharacterized protein YndB with AHSA1/START domain